MREAMKDAAWMAGAAALDLGASQYALSKCPACYEGNPLMRSTGTALATKAVATAAGGWICYELRKHGHEREARWFRWGIVALWSGLAVNAAVHAR